MSFVEYRPFMASQASNLDHIRTAMQSIIGYMKESSRMTVARKLTELMEASPDLGSQVKLASKTGLGQTTIGRIRRGEVNATADNLRRIAEAFGVPVGFLYDETAQGSLFGQGRDLHSTQLPVTQRAPVESPEVLRIPVFDPEAFDGESLAHGARPGGYVLKEGAFYDKHGVSGDDIIAVRVIGNANANFLVDGDVAFFDSRRTDARSGQMFLVAHPDGLQIRQLRRLVDSSLVLESLNPDKVRYPDEIVHPSHVKALKLIGEFFYRQGG